MSWRLQPCQANRGSTAACGAARVGSFLISLLLLTGSGTPTAWGQPTSLRDAFETAFGDHEEGQRRQTGAPRAARSQPARTTPAPNRLWQPQGMHPGKQLQWGPRLAQAEVPPPPEMMPGEGSPQLALPPSNEALPPPMVQGTLPLAGSASPDNVELSQDENGLITLIVRDASLSQVLAMLAQRQGLNIVAANDIDALISITLRGVPVDEALTAILSVANYTWVQRNNIILVTSLADATNLAADVQDRQIQVFELDFVSATALAESVTNFLSPVGKVSVSASDPADNRRARELIVVEDLPGSLARIAAYIQQVDCPPRQVQIEAHVLQVRLSDEIRCGVDLHALCRIAGSEANFFSVPSLGTATAGGGLGLPNTVTAPAVVATFVGNDLQAIIDVMQRTTDSKTLGSPKLLVLNGQQAHIQVGETIYYSQTTTTETSSQQGAASVETGVILRITPRITQDGRVLLRVEPQVSSPTGERPSVDLPPNVARIELQSDVMLRDGEGMIIGGLIDERDVTSQDKFPYLGDVKGIGWLFRKTTTTKERREVLFALVPRILPYDAQWQAYEQGELVRAGVPLLQPQQGPILRNYRPWDPVLPDGKRVYIPLVPHKPHFNHAGGPAQYDYEQNSQYVVPPYPLPEQNFYGACEDGTMVPIRSNSPTPFLSDEALPPQ